VRCHRVLTDDVKVGRLATEHLLASGRRAIAHIGGPAVVHAERRQQGYREALRAHGVEAKAGWIIAGGFMENDGYQAMKRLLESRARIDGVFAANDPAAIGAMKAVWEAGLSVPDDIAIVGAGNVVHSDLLRVPLTTVSWSKEEMGRRAAELILDQMGPHPKGPFRRVIVPPELIVRGSSGIRQSKP
jgi:LacI family transcriptional regulator